MVFINPVKIKSHLCILPSLKRVGSCRKSPYNSPEDPFSMPYQPHQCPDINKCRRQTQNTAKFLLQAKLPTWFLDGCSWAALCISCGTSMPGKYIPKQIWSSGSPRINVTSHKGTEKGPRIYSEGFCELLGEE